MTTLATLAIKLIADATGVMKVMDDTEKKTSAWSANVSKFAQQAGQGLATMGKTIFTSAAVMTGAALTGATIALKSSVEEALEAQKVQAQLNAVLGSTNGIAGITADMVNELAGQYSNLTMFEDDAIVSAESILLTFTNIGKDVFPTATETVLDMSQALGQDLQSSAIQLGKALQDPIEGVTALKRVGVNFTDAQMEMIKAMVASGDVMGAQKMILKELQTEFGGSAEAAGKTFAGQLEILVHKVSDFKESIGFKLLPSIQGILDIFIEIANRPEVQEFLTGLIDKIGKAGELIAQAFGVIAKQGLLGFFTTFEDGSSYVGNFLELMGMSKNEANKWGEKINNVVQRIIETFNTIVAAFQNDKGLIVAAVTTIGVTLAAAAWSIMAPLLPLIAVVLLIAGVIYLAYTAWTQNWGGIQEKTAALWSWLQPILQNIWEWLSINVPKAIQFLSEFWNNKLVPGVQAAWATIQEIIQAGLQFIENLNSGKLGGISELWNNTWNYIKLWFNTAVENIKSVFKLFSLAFQGDWRGFGEELRKIWDRSWKLIKETVSTAWDNIKTIVSNLINDVKNFFTNTDWGALGKQIVEGIVNGLQSMGQWALDQITNFGQAIADVLAGFFDINSPSGLMERMIGEPLAMGVVLGWEKGLAGNPFTPALTGAVAEPMANVPAVRSRGGGAGSGIILQFTYAPAVSLGDRYEAEQVLAPMIVAEVRKRLEQG